MIDTVNHFSIDIKNEMWIKDKYEEFIKAKKEGYCLLSLSLKNFADYQQAIGCENREEVIKTAFDLICGCLEKEEYIVRIHSCYFNLLIKCEASEEALHKKVPSFHFAVRDGMEKRYAKKMYLEMGFFPIIHYDIPFYTAQYCADSTRLSLQSAFVETNYDMYYVSYTNQDEEFRKVESLAVSALENGHFKLYLQPKVNLTTGEVYAAEALMRWIDPQRGMIPLTQFLAGIEKNGFIREVDLYLFDKACQYIEKWRKQFCKDIQISFNLSAAYFNGQYFYPEYKEVFDKYDIPSECICIELLESVILNDIDQLNKIVDDIYKLHFECALDDFGSGFSSFDILTNVTLTELKIDRSLFQNIENEKERSLLKHIVAIAKEFGIRCVAEGIESKAYCDYMKAIGCDYIQGFYYYKPMPVDDFEEQFIIGKKR